MTVVSYICEMRGMDLASEMTWGVVPRDVHGMHFNTTHTHKLTTHQVLDRFMLNGDTIFGKQ